ncbi:MAG: glycosyltransferase family 39 protein [Microgenomates group bacterium]|jgi:4-amino-4-deoxy-L-arabinose transferase-like glycosyltransferase
MRKSFIILIIITLLGGYLRIIDIGNIPAGLNVDEVAIGYDAYSILKTGKDMSGSFMPISFQSLGDYKAPLYTYLTSIVVAVFGLNEFSVRFISAFFGTLAIPLIFFLTNNFFKNNKISVFSALFLAISPWHIFYSRIVSESQVAMVLATLGLLALIKFKNGNILWGYISVFSMVSSMYAYHSERLFLPLFFLIWAFINKSWLIVNKKKVALMLLMGAILASPLLIDLVFGKSTIRAGQQSIYNDINFLRQVFITPEPVYTYFDPFYILFNQQWLYVIFFVIRKYLTFFQPDFLFFNALPILSTGLYGLGVMYIFQAPIFLIGLIKAFSLKSDNKYLLPIWFSFGLLPAAITLAEYHTVRTMVVIPVLAIVSGVGLWVVLNWFMQIRNKFLKVATGLVFFLVVSINLFQAFLMFHVHFPIEQSDTFMVGNKEVLAWIAENNNNKEEVVFDSRRFSNGQIIVSVPYLYYLFYTKYDPKAFQTLFNDHPDNQLKINNFTFRDIDWRTDRGQSDILFIGSPWTLPEEDLTEATILKKIYLPNGNETLRVVAP